MKDWPSAGCRVATALSSWAIPAYYGRFGFVPASDYGLTDPYGGGPAFQAIQLRQGALEQVTGAVRFAPEFDAFAPDEGQA